VLDLTDFHLAELQQEPWPSPLMHHMHAAGLAVAGAALAMLVALVPVWRGSGWRTWRRAHATLFAVAFAILAVLLWH
jgi:hypothetical protein